MLSSTLQAVVSQRLLPSLKTEGMVPAVEVLVTTGTIRDCIVNPEKTSLITQVMREGVTQHKMQTFDQALMKLYQTGEVSLDDAMRASSNPHELELRLKGIQSTSDTSWKEFENVTPDKEKV